MVSFGGLTAEQHKLNQIKTQASQTTGLSRTDREYMAEQNHDPLPTVTDLKRTPTATLRSMFGDSSMWLGQMVDDYAILARRYRKLRVKLQDPALADSPNRNKAIRRAQQMQNDIEDGYHVIAELEASCDRYWQAMDTESRGHWAVTWGTVDRLIGRCWSAFPQVWPQSFRVREQWLFGLAPGLRNERRKAAVLSQRLGSLPDESAWDDTTDHHSDTDGTR